MSDSVLADFVGTFIVETSDWDEPTKGRVLLNNSQLVFASDGEKERIRIDDIFDVNTGSAPRNLDPVPKTPITIAFESAGQRSVAVIGAEESTIEKFGTVLFKTILNGRRVTIKHPARVGGRVTDEEYQPGKLQISGHGLQCQTSSSTVSIDYTAVTSFSRMSHEIDGQERTTLTIGHMHNGAGQTTHIATDTTRTSSILGRYLRQQYDELIASLEDVSLTETAVEALTTMYTVGGSPRQLVSVLGEDPDTVKRMLRNLGKQGLIRQGGDGFELTTKGQVVVNHYMARINN